MWEVGMPTTNRATAAKSSITTKHVTLPAPGGTDLSSLLKQYGCGPIPLVGADNGFYDRHLAFDNVTSFADADPREKFEALARSVRDILSQRWVRTEETYDRENPKRVY